MTSHSTKATSTYPIFFASDRKAKTWHSPPLVFGRESQIRAKSVECRETLRTNENWRQMSALVGVGFESVTGRSRPPRAPLQGGGRGFEPLSAHHHRQHSPGVLRALGEPS